MDDEAEDVRGVMLHALRRKDAETRRVATEYFHEHGDGRAVPELVNLTKDTASCLRRTALEALGMIGGAVAFATLETFARTRGELQAAALDLVSRQPDGEARARAVARELIRAAESSSRSASIS